MAKVNPDTLYGGAREIYDVYAVLNNLSNALMDKLHEIKTLSNDIINYNGVTLIDTQGTKSVSKGNNPNVRVTTYEHAKINGTEVILETIQKIESLLETIDDTANYFNAESDKLETIAEEVENYISRIENELEHESTNNVSALQGSLGTLFAHGISQVYDANGYNLNENEAKEALDSENVTKITYKYNESNGKYQIIINGSETNYYISALTAANQKRLEYKTIHGYDITGNKNYLGDYNVDNYKPLSYFGEGAIAAGAVVYGLGNRENYYNQQSRPNNINGKKIVNSITSYSEKGPVIQYIDEDGNSYIWDSTTQKYELYEQNDFIKSNIGDANESLSQIKDTVASIGGGITSVIKNSKEKISDSIKESIDGVNETLSQIKDTSTSIGGGVTSQISDFISPNTESMVLSDKEINKILSTEPIKQYEGETIYQGPENSKLITYNHPIDGINNKIIIQENVDGTKCILKTGFEETGYTSSKNIENNSVELRYEDGSKITINTDGTVLGNWSNLITPVKILRGDKLNNELNIMNKVKYDTSLAKNSSSIMDELNKSL